jgi:stress-induced morphogen
MAVWLRFGPSGGCGAMYKIKICSDSFVGKRTLQQHQMVMDALKVEVKSMHGLTISTEVPKPAADA